MLTTKIILLVAFGYMGLLFAIAYLADRRAAQGRSIISNPYIYALSLAVYCTAWTFYGSVGRAAAGGLDFLPTYIGPTLLCALGWVVLRKIIRISKIHRITSIADFISSRYGKSGTLGSMVAIIAVLGIIPYIALQLKAISMSFNIINQYPLIVMPRYVAHMTVLKDTAFYVALLLALFAILFGTRHLDATERHEGVVAAIAFESIVKLLAFLCVGVVVTYGMFQGLDDLFAKVSALPRLQELFISDIRTGHYFGWSLEIILSMLVLVCLPRQFQVIAVENVNEDHLQKAMWLFPLYLLAINLFVLPIAFGGSLYFTAGVDADTFVLTLPIALRHAALALLVFIGGMSAATGMVIMATVALSTMICNDLVMPVLLRLPFTRVARRRRPQHHGPEHPPGEHRPGALVGLRLLPLHRRSLRPGVHRPHLLRGRRPVRARHAGGHFLEARNAHRRHQRVGGRLRRLGLHPGTALPGGSRADEPGGGHPGAARSDRPEAFPLVRTGRARSHRARRVLDPAGQCRLVRGRVPLQPAERPRAHPGGALRRCVHLPGQSRKTPPSGAVRPS